MNALLKKTWVAVVVLACLLNWPGRAQTSKPLLNPAAPALNARAPRLFDVRLETNKGVIVIEVRRESHTVTLRIQRELVRR